MKHELNTDTEKRLDMRKPRAKRSLEPISGVGRELPRRGLDVGVGGKRWVKRWVNLRKGGQEAGKWCSFSHFENALTHLFPHKSMQVVDFPRICTVRHFWGSPEMLATEGTPINTDLGQTWTRKEWDKQRLERERCEITWEKLRIVAGKSAKFRESARKFAQIRPVNPRLFGLLRVRLIFLKREPGNEGVGMKRAEWIAKKEVTN